MQEFHLRAKKREITGKKVKQLRNNSEIPAVVYGRKSESFPITIGRSELIKIAREAGESTIIDLDVESEKSIKVLIRDLQRHPVQGDIIHADFYQVDMNQEIETEIPLEFTGESAAVEELEGNLITNKDSVRVRCLPDKLVSEIKVDISALRTFEDLIHVKDLNIPEGIEVLDDVEEIVAQVTPPRSEEELAEMQAETVAETEKAQIESMEAEAQAEKAAKEAEGAEGEAPPPAEEKQEEKK